MSDSYSSKVQLWDGWQMSPADGRASAGHPQPALALPAPDHLFAAESLGPRSAHPADGVEAFSLQWFLDAEHQRHNRHARWLGSTLEFAKHAGETLLCLGNGLGTDWVQYARQGAQVIVCSPSAEQLALVRRNFDLRELPARFVQSSPSSLPLDPASIDVVCLSDWLQRVREPHTLISEVYRVLKPGGKVLALTPARYNIDFWRRLLLPWRWRFGARRSPEPQFTARMLRGLFHLFSEHRVHKRHLRRADVPHVWRMAPTSMLERMIGRILVLKAFKPLSTAIPVLLAA